MIEFSKFITYAILIVLIITCIALGIFLITNWNFINNPNLVPGYIETQATFSYGRDNLAKYRYWCFHYPMATIPYLIYIQSILLVHLIFKKNLLLTKFQWLAIFLFLLFMIFSDFIFDNLSEIFDSNNYRQAGYHFNNFLGSSFFIAFLFLLFASIILMFIAKFKNYRKFLILNLATILVFVIFVFAHFEFFFD